MDNYLSQEYVECVSEICHHLYIHWTNNTCMHICRQSDALSWLYIWADRFVLSILHDIVHVNCSVHTQIAILCLPLNWFYLPQYTRDQACSNHLHSSFCNRLRHFPSIPDRIDRQTSALKTSSTRSDCFSIPTNRQMSSIIMACSVLKKFKVFPNWSYTANVTRHKCCEKLCYSAIINRISLHGVVSFEIHVILCISNMQCSGGSYA